jgi:hypothetical protein
MNNRKGKCPGCGLVNFRDAAECQWCALALSGRTRNELVDDMPAAPDKPWGLLLMLFALVIMGGGVLWHVSQKIAARAELVTKAAEAADDDAKLPKRKGPPSLGGRSPSDPPRDQELDYIKKAIENNRREMEKNGDSHRGLYGFDEGRLRQAEIRRNTEAQQARKRRLEDQQRGMYRQPVSTPDERNDW